MHSDGYAGFGALARAGPIREVACLAHVRRKFFDVYAAQGSAIAAETLEWIASLYAIENESPRPAARAACCNPLRQGRAAPRRAGALAANAAAEDPRDSARHLRLCQRLPTFLDQSIQYIEFRLDAR